MCFKSDGQRGIRNSIRPVHLIILIRTRALYHSFLWHASLLLVSYLETQKDQVKKLISGTTK